MSTPQRFVQILEFETDRIDDMRALGEEGDQRLAGRPGGPVRRLVLKDRSRPDRYLVVVEFDSYEEAMRNSDDPETGKFAQAMAALCTTPPSFTDCDVVDAADFR
ncbi:hypothetical protein KMT30_23060 [Streptomyces sp. IBSBF 2953]|uniref:hypothetical protein n=1 Tax=Streptomyces TaxID=1883 RepID=UPI00211A04B8|nr:hypothetical protein [Streptomyces scabiei]MCQ9181877.1 hypothetical protein [Streptomyces hayashii]MDX3114660.1 hypothetical protein [Streptomyces scabiei]